MTNKIVFHGLGRMTQALMLRLHPFIQVIQHSSRAPFDQKVDPTACMHIAATSSQGISWLVDSLKRYPPSSCYLVSKGLCYSERGILTFPEYIQEHAPGWKVGMMAGPALASDLASGASIHFLLAGDGKEPLNAFFDDRIHWQYSDDLRGVCLLSALKNIYAIMLGYAHAQAPSTFAWVYQAILEEWPFWIEHWGGKALSVRGLAGVGDLLLTGLAGRNAQLGRSWAMQNKKISQVLEEDFQGITLEGFYLAQLLLRHAAQDFKKFPESLLTGLLMAIHRDDSALLLI